MLEIAGTTPVLNTSDSGRYQDYAYGATSQRMPDSMQEGRWNIRKYRGQDAVAVRLESVERFEIPYPPPTWATHLLPLPT